MNTSKFEEYLTDRFTTLDESDARYAKRHRWDMFLPKNYETIRENMDEQGIKPNIVDIGCGAGFGSEFFLDGSYVGIDKRHPHIGFGNSAAKLGNQFYNEGKHNVSFIIDEFPNKTISEIVKKKTLISSMSLGAYGELLENDWERIFMSYCKGMENAENIYICAPERLTKFASNFFGDAKQIGRHWERSAEDATECPIIHIMP